MPVLSPETAMSVVSDSLHVEGPGALRRVPSEGDWDDDEYALEF